MSLIRFVHAGPVRLGTAISGVSDAPAWLSDHLASSVRQAFCNVLETAEANHADFVFLDGPLTECSELRVSVARWVGEQLSTFRRRGIQVVVRATDTAEASLYLDLADVVLQQDQQLLVRRMETTGRLEYTIDDHSVVDHTRTYDLRVSPSQTAAFRGQHAYDAITSSHIQYQCLTGTRPSEECDGHFTRGVASLCPGAIQAIGPDESWDCGCVLVEVNPATREIETEFLETDVVRFSSEDLTLPATVSAASVVDQLVDNAITLGRASAKTLIVDWKVQGDFKTDWTSLSSLSEFEVLEQLRQKLQSGHRGIWPRRISSSDSYRFDLSTGSRHESVEEYIQLTCGEVAAWANGNQHSQRVAFKGTRAKDAAIVEGLRLLNRAA